MKKLLFVTGLMFLGLGVAVSEAAAAPKYGPNAVPISKRSNLEYFQKNPAPDFWALMPYYTPQLNGRQCSAANMTMVLNAARADQPLTSADELVTISSFLKKWTPQPYSRAMSDGLSRERFDRSQVSVRNLAEVLKTAVQKIGLQNPQTRIELMKVEVKELEKNRKSFHESLVRNEKSASDFMILNLMQGTLTGDPEGGAHVVTVGGYDEKKKLVLILDPDREWYEPYWSPEDQVFDAVANPKSDGESPGWIEYRVR